LDADAVLAAARAFNADAIHPGYGFLAESAPFAQAVADAGRVWIGPRPETIEDMGDKERTRDIARACAVPVLPGSARFMPGDSNGIAEAAAAVGFPLLVKAAAGGGGIGMRREAPRGLTMGLASREPKSQPIRLDAPREPLRLPKSRLRTRSGLAMST
jgi:3-methylcrotonyl-CoA carboxylase alpha subunit